METTIDWKVIHGHLWPDRVYDIAVRYLKNEPDALLDLPVWVADTLKKRIHLGKYSLEGDRIVLVTRDSELPWNAMSNQHDKTYVFRVVKESDCKALVERFMNNISLHALNCKTLSKRILQNGYLGVSRRFVKTVLDESVAMKAMTTIPKKAIIRSFKPKFPFEHWQMDLIDVSGWSVANSNYSYIMVIIDIFSKFVYLFPLKKKSAVPTAVLLNKLFLTGDIPMILHSDQGPEFINSDVRKVCETFHVKQIWGESYTPQTQGFVECKNKYIKRLMHFFLHNTNQDRPNRYLDVLEEIAFTINNTQHSVTKLTPMMLHRGRQIPTRVVEVAADYMSDMGNAVAIATPTDHELVNYMVENEGFYQQRVTHMRKLLLINALKQDDKYRRDQSQAVFSPGDNVAVFTYRVQADGGIQPTILKRTDGSRIESPLVIGKQKVTTVQSYPRTMFSKLNLATKKVYTHVFKVVTVHPTTVTLNCQQMRATVPNWTTTFGKTQLVLIPSMDTIKPGTKPEYNYVDLSDQLKNRQPPCESSKEVSKTPVPKKKRAPPKGPSNDALATIQVTDILKQPKILKKRGARTIVIRFAFREISNDGEYTGGVRVRRVVVHEKRGNTQKNDRGVVSPWDVKMVNKENTGGTGSVIKVQFDPTLYGRMDTIDGWVFDNEHLVRTQLYALTKQ
jgi:hypothetical protein